MDLVLGPPCARRGYRRLANGFRLALLLTAFASVAAARSEVIKLRHRAGVAHGFLVLRDESGSTLASGELTQIPLAGRIQTRVTFHFRDGSLDDEMIVYSEHNGLRLITDHLVQRGPAFPHPCDTTIDEPGQQLTTRVMKDGKAVGKAEHMALPPDLANGILFTLIENLIATSPRVELPYLALTAKPRMVKLAIAEEGEVPFKVSGRTYKAMEYDVKINLGGLTGIVAPLVGKQPPDTHVWVSESGVPAIVRIDGPLYPEGPVWSIELASPVW